MQKYTGLSWDQARQKAVEYGPNEIEDAAKISALKILLRQTRKNFMIYLLLLAALLSFWVGKDVTGYTILAVIAVVISVGFFQEYRAEKAISALKSMILPKSIVIRGGKETDIPSRDLVPGDLVVLGNGERVPADCQVLWSSDLRLDEAVLTGESREVGKKAGEAIYMGTYVVLGRCIARVEHIGMNTKFGGIAKMISTAEKELPLVAKVNRITKYMATVAIVISLATGGLMIWRTGSFTGPGTTEVIVLVIALSVSAFPEGFPVVLITTLASGAARMAKRNAIVNRMSIIETLGETTVICTDKTGTLTAGEMTVRQIICADKVFAVGGSGYVGRGEITENGIVASLEREKVLQQLVTAAIVANDARIERTGQDSQYRVLGTPTEGSLLILAAKVGIFKENLGYERVAEEPFSSEKKMMSVTVKNTDGSYVFAKGAAEVLIDKCVYVMHRGKKIGMTANYRQKILTQNREMNQKSLRTLGIAAAREGEKLTWLGLVGMEDPPRPEAAGAVADCRRAGIIVKMITGDNAQTAASIAAEVGIEGQLIEGSRLDQLSDRELETIVKQTAIFARVEPGHKLRIVKALKRLGEIVTMTGDGVNDAPALKEAHIGVAMGIKGTDVSRSVADMTLKDDNFATIVAAIAEGRTIFNNIRKFVSYQLSVNAAELGIIFTGVILAPILGWPIPLLLALHILFMNLVTDNLPAITLGLNPNSADIMDNLPRRGAQILNRPLVGLIIFSGLVMAILTLGVYAVEFNVLGQGVEVSRTAALAALIGLEVTNAFNFRSFRKPVMGRSIWVNPYLVYASGISLLATGLVLYTPWGNRVFETTPIGVFAWIPPVVCAVIIIIIFDLVKAYCNRRDVWLTRAAR